MESKRRIFSNFVGNTTIGKVSRISNNMESKLRSFLNFVDHNTMDIFQTFWGMLLSRLCCFYIYPINPFLWLTFNKGPRVFNNMESKHRSF